MVRIPRAGRKAQAHVRAEYERLLLAGDAGRAEALRIAKGANINDTDEPVIWTDEYRRRRYALGGTHERLRNAAVRVAMSSAETARLHGWEYKCFIGVRHHSKMECM